MHFDILLLQCLLVFENEPFFSKARVRRCGPHHHAPATSRDGRRHRSQQLHPSSSDIISWFPFKKFHCILARALPPAAADTNTWRLRSRAASCTKLSASCQPPCSVSGAYTQGVLAAAAAGAFRMLLLPFPTLATL
jgi:hypothetical protein